MEFKTFATAVAKQFSVMSRKALFRVEVAPDLLWQTYLASFPAGSNPIYKERAEHDCNCCKSFVRNAGSVVAIVDGKMASIWDIAEDSGFYSVVASAMSKMVHSLPIANLFLHTERIIGASKSRQLLEDKSVREWDHFSVNLPASVVCSGDAIGPRLSSARSSRDVMLRSLREMSLDATDSVLELIAQNSLYRGSENTHAVEQFRKMQVQFSSCSNADLFVWERVGVVPESVARIRNTAIGTLLTDISEGKDLDEAVKAFESKVAPANYKRPTAVVTKAMIQKAQQAIDELGYGSALGRRYATVADITVNNVLFADRETRRDIDVFDQLSREVVESPKKFGKVEEIAIDRFLSDVLPKATSIEVLVENRHAPNFVSLIAPVDPTAKQMFKWPNNFSWTYAGDVADSIKEKVKRAGGRVDVDLRCSLSWFNYDDLDLHLTEPSGNEIYYGSKVSRDTGGNLDVDMNAGCGTTRSAVENICYPLKSRIREGIYKLRVHNYSKRETKDVGFDAEIEYDGQLHSFSFAESVPSCKFVNVAEFRYSKNGLEIINSLPQSQASKKIWDLPTQTFHRATMVMLSPNHWDEIAMGNKHYLFMLSGCRNEDKARGFYNEFLSEELSKHRKVLEVVGAKMRTDESNSQLSGLGFSSTQRNSLTVRVSGKISRTLKVVF